MSDPDPHHWPVGKVGYVAIVGRPNVGKSTLINHLLGEHLLAVSPLPQTTRQHWRGILSDATSQLILVDTPGAHVGKTKLNQAMLKTVFRALEDADTVLCIADPTRPQGDEDELVAKRVSEGSTPVVLAINKTDEATPVQIAEAREFYLGFLPDTTPVYEISAATGHAVPTLLDKLKDGLPQGPFFFPPDQAMDAVERTIGQEMIREAALELLREEVPHALAVEISEWKVKGDKLRIQATIFVERDSQKGIVVGKNGAMVAEVRRRAIARLREWQDCYISLSLFVKVASDWRNKTRFLREHGLVEDE